MLYITGGYSLADYVLRDTTFPEQHSATFNGWTIGAGVETELNSRATVRLEYRYNDFSQRRVAFAGYELGATPEISTVMVGLSWRLGAEAPPPPPPPPPPLPPAPPPPPPPVKTFIVFFDFDMSNLTDKALEVVQEAVHTAKTNGFVKVLVTGHTDTVGSDSYNQALSIRRAESVKDEMVKEGLDGSGISIEGKSFHDPLVPTGPGVREPQNRRAVIDLGG
jgi:outer membrane protein OmpA-like peptidoglycan-associated protein